MFTQEPPLPGIELLAKPEEKLAGVRLDPALLTPSRLEFALDLKAQYLKTGLQISIPLPDNSDGIRYLRFNPNPPQEYCLQQFVCVSKAKGKNELVPYIGTLTKDAETQEFHWKLDEVKSLKNYRMNFCNGCAYQFTSDGTKLLVKAVPRNHAADPPQEPLSVGPSVQAVSKDARKAPGRTYQDLLKNPHDEEKFRHFMTTELICVDLSTAAGFTSDDSAKIIGPSEGGRIFLKIVSSPCGKFVLVESITKLSYAVPMRRFGKDVEVWALESIEEGKANVAVVASLPVDDEIPLSYDACSRHPRSFTFHPCLPHTILYVQAVDGGDPESPPVDGNRDVIYTQDIVAAETDLQLETPKVLTGLEWRYDDIDFTESGDLCLVSEYRWKDRKERLWMMTKTGALEKKMIWERNWQDRYASPGAPMTRSGTNGKHYLVEPKPGHIYLNGAGASPLGDRPFLDMRNLNNGETERLWRCKAPKDGDLDADKEVKGQLPSAESRQDVFESLVLLLNDNDTILMSRESKISPRNYFLTQLSDLAKEVTVTSFPHPQPDLLGISKELVHYKRSDGVALTANLYLPKDFNDKPTPRPTLFWAYPREFKDAKAAGQVKGSQHRFVSAHWASPIHWAARGWAVMDDFALPVIGEGDTQPNDTFIDQIVDGASSAVNYAVQRGVTDAERCAVGGHSYGSFMTAHLLSHTSLFAAGVGRSGAFNRTLTPMSFQSEDRSMWEAPDTYIEMSPIMHAKKYSEQTRVGKLLLIHGDADENSGTHPLQSERYFMALKAFGIESRLCKLPHERHSYRARESILHMAWEQEEWLKSLEP